MIIIKEGKNHFAVEIECQSFFYLTKEAMMLELSKYLDNKSLAEEEYRFFQEYVKRNQHPIPLAPEQMEPGGIIFTDEFGAKPATQPAKQERRTL